MWEGNIQEHEGRIIEVILEEVMDNELVPIELVPSWSSTRISHFKDILALPNKMKE